MKVILTEDMRGTGKRGETIDVKDGFGRTKVVGMKDTILR